MKKIISLMLSLIIILSLVCVAAPTVSAASAMKTSEMGVNMIKSFEGFRKWPEMDNGQWTVGYGTGISDEDLTKYSSSGITQEEATKLLAEYLGTFEASVNDFIDDHNLKLAQHQFDALVSFTYNLGPSWMQSSGTFRSAVINGKTGNDLIYAIGQFGKAGGAVVGGLVERRLCEANLYLNGAYSAEVPANYKYVIYNGNMEDVVPTVTIQAYDATKVAAVKSTATKSGYRFLGWYTKADGGKLITSLGQNSASETTLYAHWQEGEGPLNSDGSIKGTATEYSGYAPNGAQSIYDAPNGKKVGTTKATEQLKVSAEYVDSKGVKWGKIADKKWINVTDGLSATPNYEEAGSAISPITVTVTGNNINNRIGPGTNYAKQGTYSRGEQLVLTAVQKGGNYTWGKSERGWIALIYTDYETSKIANSEDAKKVTAIGTVINTNVLNVRTGAGTNYPKKDTYNRNDQVKITLQQKVGNSTWGLTEKGWISLYYVKVTPVEAGSVPDIEISTGVTGTTGGTTTTIPGSTVVGGTNTATTTGMVYNCDVLRIRSGAGTSNAHIGNYARGTYVTILRTETVKTEVWGYTGEGWISLRYVKLDAPTTGLGITGRVVKCETLNVRSGAGTHYPKSGKLAKGTKVEILEYTKVGNATWGRISEGGWISLYYVALDTALENLNQNSGTAGGTGSSGTESAPTEPAPTEPNAKTYEIKVESTTNGSVQASAEAAAKGEIVSLDIAPKSGYVQDKLTVKDADGNVISVTDNQFTMPASKVTVKVTFKEAAKKYSIAINSASNGKVTASASTAAAGEEIILTAAPNSGYELDSISAMNTTNNTQVTVSNGKFTMPEGNVNIVATFKKASGDTFKVEINSVSNGSVTANVTSAKAGDTVILTINPAEGYALDALTIKDASNATVAASGTGNTRTFTMPSGNVTIAAYFTAVKYNVTVATSENGSVSVNPDVYKKGESVSVTVTPANGYVLDKLIVKDASNAVITATGNKFTMPASNVTVSATFKKNEFTVNLTTGANGEATISSKNAKLGDVITVKFTPKSNYELNTLAVKDAEGNAIEVSGTGNTRAFTMPASNVTVDVTFKIIKRDVEIVASANGKVTPSAKSAAKDAAVTLTVKADAGYELDKLTVKDAAGKDVAVKDNKFTMPESKVTVTATFKKLSYTITTGTIDKGKVTGAPEKASIGDTITLTVTPDSGYILDMLIVKDAAKNDIAVSGTGNTRTFTMPASKVTIDATFKVAPVFFDVTVDSAIANGTVTVDKASAEANETITLTVTPAEGYELDQLTVNGSAISGNTFKMPKENAVVAATFKAVRTITITVRDAEGDRLQGVSVALYNQAGGFVQVVAAKVSNANGVITFTTSDLAGITKGMRLVAQVEGSYTFADTHPVRDAVASVGVTKGEDGNSNDWLDVTAESNAPISGTFTVRVKPAT